MKPDIEVKVTKGRQKTATDTFPDPSMTGESGVSRITCLGLFLQLF